MQITKPTTQRKKLFQAPAHLRHKQFSAHLSPDLKKKHGTNTVPLRMGDTVRMMRGDRKGFEGKITRVDYKKYRLFIDGITREKVDGTTIQIPTHPSKVMIVNLNLDDKWRRRVLKRKRLLEKEEMRPTDAEPVAEAEAEKMPEEKKTAEKVRRKKKRKKEPTKPAPKKAKKSRTTKNLRRKRTKKPKTKKGAE